VKGLEPPSELEDELLGILALLPSAKHIPELRRIFAPLVRI
jgi:hypothetical protein